MTSHKIPEGLAKSEDDDEDTVKRIKLTKDVIEKMEKLDKKVQSVVSVDQSLEPSSGDDIERKNSKRQARVELENFSDTGVLQEEGIRKLDTHRAKDENEDKDDVIPGVQVRYCISCLIALFHR